MGSDWEGQAQTMMHLTLGGSELSSEGVASGQGEPHTLNTLNMLVSIAMCCLRCSILCNKVISRKTRIILEGLSFQNPGTKANLEHNVKRLFFGAKCTPRSLSTVPGGRCS